MTIRERIYRMLPAVLLGVLACVVAVVSGLCSSSGNGISMATIYGITAAISLLLLAYFLHRRMKEPWLLLLFISVTVTNLGYFLLSLSQSLSMAMMANRISYLGSVLLPLCMLMIIMGLCAVPVRKAVMRGLIGVSVLVFLLAASGGILPLYYTEVTVEIVDGAAKLHKEYGPLHFVYLLYLLAHLGAMIGVILRASRRKVSPMHRYAPIMCVVVLLNLAIWFVEQQIQWEFEFLSVSYIISELLLLLIYDILSDARAVDPVPDAPAPDAPAPDAPEDISLHDLCPTLTARELEVLQLILENRKRKEIAEALFVSENTVKKHMTHIYEKMEVSDRNELVIKLGKAAW